LPDAVPLDEKQLDDHSQSFAQALFSAHPSWWNSARMEKSSGGNQMILVVTVEPPESSKGDHPLIIDTDNEEITVGFDAYHAHFDWPNDPNEEYGNALRFVEAITEERVAVVSLWAGERWAMSTTLDVSSGETALNNIPEGATLKKIRSWNGRYSRNEPLP